MKNNQLIDIVEPIVSALGLSCLGLELLPQRQGSLLRIYIDAPEGVTVEHCEKVSREVEAALDAHDPIGGRYVLEVSSPGVERPLFAPEQFARFVGEQARVELKMPIDGRRRFTAVIRSVQGDELGFLEGQKEFKVDHRQVLKAHLAPDLAALGIGKVPKPKKGKAGKRDGDGPPRANRSAGKVPQGVKDE